MTVIHVHLEVPAADLPELADVLQAIADALTSRQATSPAETAAPADPPQPMTQATGGSSRR